MPRQNWILIAIALSPAGALQPAQLQSTLCLLGKKLTPEQLKASDFYPFEAHGYGTFTLPVHLDAEQMVETGLLELRNDLWPAREYVITTSGRHAVRSAMLEISSNALKYAEDAVRWITSFTVQELIHVELNTFQPPPANSA